MLRNASSASFAMLTPHRHSVYALHTKVLIIELPKAKKLFNDRLLLASTAQFWHIAWIFEHAVDVKVHAETVRDTKQDIKQEVFRIGICDILASRYRKKEVRETLLGKIVVSHLPPTQKEVAAKTPAKKGLEQALE